MTHLHSGFGIYLNTQACERRLQTYPLPQGGRGRTPAGHSFRTGAP